MASATSSTPTWLLVILSCSLFACSEPAVFDSPLKTLSEDSNNFELPSVNNKITFPRAHTPHKSFRQEWWYLTANLETAEGKQFATQWTLFRRAVEDKHWYFAHAALADKTTHYSDYRNGREETGSVVVQSLPFKAQIDDWLWTANSDSSADLLPAYLEYGNKPKTGLTKAEQSNDWAVSVQLNSKEPFYLQGKAGFSQKHPVQNIASHYYSQPFIDVQGQVYWQGKWHEVTGQAWFDREWGTKMLAEDQQGWDWFSLRLNENQALMVYQIRSNKKTHIYASLMERGGKIYTYDTPEVQVRNLNGAELSSSGYPTQFVLQIEDAGIDIEVKVINEEQIMRYGIEYFEGMVSFNGSHQGQGFLEMTGYQ